MSIPPCSALRSAAAATPSWSLMRCRRLAEDRSSFALYGEMISCRDGRCETQSGRLAGTVLDMASAVANCIRLLGVALPDALRFASTNPATLLGLDHVLGKIVPGHRADLVAFDPNDIRIIATWVEGGEDQDKRRSCVRRVGNDAEQSST